MRGPIRGVLVYSDKILVWKLMKRIKSTAKMEWGPRQELEL